MNNCIHLGCTFDERCNHLFGLLLQKHRLSIRQFFFISMSGSPSISSTISSLANPLMFSILDCTGFVMDDIAYSFRKLESFDRLSIVFIEGMDGGGTNTKNAKTWTRGK